MWPIFDCLSWCIFSSFIVCFELILIVVCECVQFSNFVCDISDKIKTFAIFSQKIWFDCFFFFFINDGSEISTYLTHAKLKFRRALFFLSKRIGYFWRVFFLSKRGGFFRNFFSVKTRRFFPFPGFFFFQNAATFSFIFLQNESNFFANVWSFNNFLVFKQQSSI